ncbi:MAG: GNAT family N-acetyltransferase [Candidatus Izimaplasma sp.]|nr:GNAT family N-acetyltransferase [Candidatus Izimaplasma bacterium]
MLITKEQYLNNPCRTLAIPYYKYISMPKRNNPRVVNDMDFSEKKAVSRNHQRFFRLIHNMSDILNTNLNGFSFVKVNIEKDISIIVRIINNSYTDIKVTKEKILNLTKIAVFLNDLWIFIRDDKSNEYVGLGIADYDHNCNEVILEWIQVLPEYRKKGLGKNLILHILKTAPKDAMFATVSGDYDNPTNPQGLYLKCGFTGNNIWHVIWKEEKYSSGIGFLDEGTPTNNTDDTESGMKSGDVNYMIWNRDKINRMNNITKNKLFDTYNSGLIEDRGYNPKLLNENELTKIEEGIRKDYIEYFETLENNIDFMFYCIIKKDKRICSACRLMKIDNKYFIEGLETHRLERQKGYGYKVLNNTLAYAKEIGIEIIYSIIRTKNISSIRTHLKCGFIEEKRVGPNLVMKIKFK